jgi:hypothetical protein
MEPQLPVHTMRKLPETSGEDGHMILAAHHHRRRHRLRYQTVSFAGHHSAEAIDTQDIVWVRSGTLWY